MPAVTIAQARARLASDLSKIQGVKRVYDTLADQMPQSPDLPCFELETQQPFLTSRGGAVGMTERTLHLNLTFYYKTEGQGKPAENITAVEAYTEATIAQLYANFTGGDTYLINKDTGTLDFTGYLFGKENAPDQTRYWGFSATLELTLFVETTMSGGS